MHNPGMSLPLIISGYGFCGYPWLSSSEEGPFSLAAREELKQSCVGVKVGILATGS